MAYNDSFSDYIRYKHTHHMDVPLWQAMCGHNTNGSVGLHKHTHKLKQQFSLAD